MALRERSFDLLNWLVLAIQIIAIVWEMEQSAQGFERRRNGFEIILPTPAPVIEQVEHFPS